MKDTCTWTELRCRLYTVEDPFSRENKGSLQQKKEAFIYALCVTEAHKIEWIISMEKAKIDVITHSSL